MRVRSAHAFRCVYVDALASQHVRTRLTPLLVCACACQNAADDNVPTAFVILVKPPGSSFIEGVKNELAEIKVSATVAIDGVKNELAGITDSATAAIEDRSATEYVSCVEKMTAMYSKGQGHARMSKVLG